MSEEFVVQLANNKLFEALKEGELAALASIATPIYFKKGQDVFAEGDTGDSFFQIIEGSVSIGKKDDQGNNHEIALLKENEIPHAIVGSRLSHPRFRISLDLRTETK